MTFRELAESQGLFVTNDNVVYFEKYETTSDFVFECTKSGIRTEVHERINDGKTIYTIIEEIKSDLSDRSTETNSVS